MIGTVLDPELEGELRVTMVATGIGGGSPMPVENPYKVVAKAPRVQKQHTFEDLDPPVVIRNRREERELPNLTDEKGIEYLDVPAFLRKQAD